MSDQPKPLSDSELSLVVGGAASAPGAGAGVPGGISTGQMPEDIYGILALAHSTANEMRNSAREARGIDMASQGSDTKSATDSFDKLVAGAPQSFADTAGAGKVDPGAQINDRMQQMMDVVKDVREKLSAIEQSQAEALRNIIKKS